MIQLRQEGSFAPLNPGERLLHLDAIRGCALLGVLLMNVHYHFRGPAMLYVLDAHPSPGLVDALVDDLLRFFVEGKAMTLFCMLFAVGLAIQLERYEARGGKRFWAFAWRRMGALFAIGLLHVVLLWEGDILAVYALAGVLLFPFLRRKPRTVYIWTASLFGFLAATVVAMLVVRMLRGGVRPPSARAAAAAAEMVARSLEVHGQGSWWDVLLFRAEEWRQNLWGQLPALLDAFASSMLGLAVWRSGIPRDPLSRGTALRGAAGWLTGAGLAAGVVALYWKPIRACALAHAPWGLALAIPAGLCAEFGAKVLALGYGALLLLAWQTPKGRLLLGPFAWAGRLALTNYLAQSLIMTAIFYGWGLGLFGKVGPAAGLALGVLVFGLQAWVSRWWLVRFLFGPAEWLWRCLSYGRFQPFRLNGAAR